MDDERKTRRGTTHRRSPPPGALPANVELERERPEAAELPRRRLSRAAKLRRAATTLAAVALAVAILAVTLPHSGTTLRGLLGIPTPVPTATPTPGAGTFLLWDNVPWGTLLVNGHAPQIAAPRYDSPGGPFAPTFALAPGRYTIEYRAAPFPTLRCMVSVPAAPSDTCPLLVAGSPQDIGRPFAAARVLDLEARPERLSGTALAVLEQAVVAGLDASTPPETLAVGDHYRGADGQVHTASQPLQAALNVTLNQDPTDLLPGDSGPCMTVCFSNQGFFPVVDQGFWTIATHAILAWRITRPDGTVVVANAPAAPVAHDAHLLARVSLRWDGLWKLAPSFGTQLDPCVVAGVTAIDVLAAATRGQGSLDFQQGLEPSPIANGDCVVVETKLTSGSTTGAGTQGWVLYRCGALVAANDLAHQLFPALPLASAHEQALAQRIAATVPTS